MKLLTILLSLILFACESNPKEPDDPEPTTATVKYEVTGTAQTVDITLSNKEEGTSQFGDVSVPWSMSFVAPRGNFVYLSAQNQGQTGTVICTIYINGDQFKSSTSSGAYVIATASGSIP